MLACDKRRQLAPVDGDIAWRRGEVDMHAISFHMAIFVSHIVSTLKHGAAGATR
jgi:hypothetical protein